MAVIIRLNEDKYITDAIIIQLSSQWFSPGTPVSSTNQTDGHDITDILLKVLNWIHVKETKVHKENH
jgi:hypothetical protein